MDSALYREADIDSSKIKVKLKITSSSYDTVFSIV